MSHEFTTRIPNSIIQDSFFSYINNVATESNPNAQRISPIGKAVFDHIAHRSAIIFAIVATPVTLSLDLIAGLAGIIFSRKKVDYVINRWVISPAQHVVLVISTLTITALHLKIGAIFIKCFLATGITPILVPVIVAFCCLPSIYNVAKKVTESLSFNAFSILRNQPNSGILYERKWFFGSDCHPKP